MSQALSSSDKGRDISIYLLKFLAVIFITNSHFGNFYIGFESLATGGAIGDALFFFCSGYTIFLGRTGRFDNWYKRRISRIYPAVFGWAIVASFVFGSTSTMANIIIHGGGWFVTCIMIYYAILYPVKVYMGDKMRLVWLLSLLVVLVWYIFFFEGKEVVYMYKVTYFKWCFFFLAMLLGANLGLVKKNNFKFTPCRDLVCLMVSVMMFYGIQILGVKYPLIARLQVVTILPLLTTVYYMWKLMNCQTALTIYQHKTYRLIIRWIGGLCLEIYLTQMFLMHWLPTYINHIFPINIPVAFVTILILAYVTHMVANLFRQTFNSQDYNWAEIFSIK